MVKEQSAKQWPAALSHPIEQLNKFATSGDLVGVKSEITLRDGRVLVVEAYETDDCIMVGPKEASA